jgi:two-component system, OmpR family, response regulator
MRILLIEDNAEVAAYLIKVLKESDYLVDHVVDGKQGLFMATHDSYDLIIIDRSLPHLDGVTISQTIRATGNETPLLIINPLAEVDDWHKGLREGELII